MKPTRLTRDDYVIAYSAITGKAPCVIFCGGFNSNMQGTKALALEKHCLSKKQAFIRFDYQGHGQSGGDFADGCISMWLADTLAIIDQLTDTDVILIGSSMGGWLALLAALHRKDRVKGLLLLACAADMTKFYPERVANLATEQDKLGRTFYHVANEYDNQEPYKVYQQLIDDGQQHFLLHDTIELNIPIHLIHGQKDDVVPWQRSQQVLERLSSSDASLHLVKHGDHRLSSQADLALLKSLLGVFL